MDAALQIERRPTRLAASSRFGGFKSEAEKSIRAQGVESNPVLDEMKMAWRECRPFYFHQIAENYVEILDRITGLGYSAIDVEAFSISLAGFQHEPRFSEKAGLFLSALINKCKQDGFTIHTAHIVKPVDYLGYLNTKIITVEGSVGIQVAREMIDGSMTINGDAWNEVGKKMSCGAIVLMGDARDFAGYQMNDGEITVMGNADRAVGLHMLGGKITVECNAGSGVGDSMKGGSITVERDAGDGVGFQIGGGEIQIHGALGTFYKNGCGGKIFHKGELVYPK